MKMNNKGLSLVELVIVITIMAVVGGGVAVGLKGALSKPAEECAEKIVASLKSARVTAMGKESCVINLIQESEGDVVYMKQIIKDGKGVTTTKDKVKIGSGGLSVKLHASNEADGSYTKLSDFGAAGIQLSFRRDTGGLKSITGTSNSADPYYNEIVVEKGDRVYKIALYNLTGNVVIE